MIVLASLLMGSGGSAQTAGDAGRMPAGNVVRPAQFQVAYSEGADSRRAKSIASINGIAPKDPISGRRSSEE